MDIQDELKEALDEKEPDWEREEAELFACASGDALMFSLGYLSAKRRLGVSKPDRRAELLDIMKSLAVAELGRENRPSNEMDVDQSAGLFATDLVKIANAMLDAVDTATKQD